MDLFTILKYKVAKKRENEVINDLNCDVNKMQVKHSSIFPYLRAGYVEATLL